MRQLTFEEVLALALSLYNTHFQVFNVFSTQGHGCKYKTENGERQ